MRFTAVGGINGGVGIGGWQMLALVLREMEIREHPQSSMVMK
jgi:hypothetical protein